MAASKLDNEQLELLHSFVEEGLEMLDEVEPQLIELERGSFQIEGVDPEVLNGIFRLFHSLKGSAGYLGLETINRVTHTAETLLDLFRKGSAVLSSEHIDLLIRTCDFMRQLLGDVNGKQTDKGNEDEAKKLIGQLGQAVTAIQQSGTPSSAEQEKNSKTLKPKIVPASKAPSEPPPEGEEAQSSTLHFTITPEMAIQFSVESQELIDQAEQALLALEKEPNNLEHLSQAFRAMHSFKGNCGMFGHRDLEKLSHQSETVLAEIKDNARSITNDLISLLLEILDELKGGLRMITEGQAAKIQGLLGWMSLLQDYIGEIGVHATAPIANAESNMADSSGGQASATEEAELERLLAEVCETAPGASTPPQILERRQGDDRRSGAGRRQLDTGVAQRQSVRVDVEKLDALLDLVGELVIAEAMVAQNPDIRGARISLDRFEKSVLHLEKISRDLQDTITSIRMIPLSGTFRKMIRLVRDLSTKAEKKIELEIIGEETEVDKTVIEQINDPLVHLIRNSIDHGIETPDKRLAAGKNEIGTITLEAKYMGSEVWILVKDDGKGLNREKILAKAIERGLLSGEGNELSDAEVWQLIFLPGFSTAEKVTDVSGRGVGMDVVKRNIENLRGKVDVRCEPEQGCVFTLRLPLTLAIIDGMVVRVGQERYIVPIVSIKETLRPNYKDVTQLMDGQQIINIRGNLIPIMSLHEIFKVQSEAKDLSEGLILMVENEGRSLCLLVDELIGQQQIVIKGLSRYIGDLQGISGCTILGDGDVSLIMDIAGIFNLSGQNKVSTPGRDLLKQGGRLQPATM
jgi:two-component system chemotaxis sensor kinase CheA